MIPTLPASRKAMETGPMQKPMRVHRMPRAPRPRKVRGKPLLWQSGAWLRPGISYHRSFPRWPQWLRYLLLPHLQAGVPGGRWLVCGSGCGGDALR